MFTKVVLEMAFFGFFLFFQHSIIDKFPEWPEDC